MAPFFLVGLWIMIKKNVKGTILAQKKLQRVKDECNKGRTKRLGFINKILREKNEASFA